MAGWMVAMGLLLALAAPLQAGCRDLLDLYSMHSGGVERWYRVHEPAGGAGPGLPVVLAFHGGGGNAREFAELTDLCTTSDVNGFLLVFAEGSGALGGAPFFLIETWNAGNCCGWAQEHDVDDVGFVRDLIDDLDSRWGIDRSRVFATGHSNGAMMSYRLAVEIPDLIAAIAPNSGALGVPGPPPAPIPILVGHGKLDCNVPFGGGVGCGVSDTDFLSQRETVQPFLDVNQASPPAQAEVRGQALRYEAAAPATDADVHYWFLLDGGHSWPGHGATFPVGEPTNFDIDFNDELWLFFSQHPGPN